MKRDVGIFLEDILESIERIKKYTKDVKEKEFYNNSQIADAVVRRFEIIGEAVKQIPGRTKEPIQKNSMERDCGNKKRAYT